MEISLFKAINFDLNTKAMAKYFPRYTDGYGKLAASLKKQGFEHRQGSGYVSKEKLTSLEVNEVIRAVAKENPWLGECVKKIDVTDIGLQFNLIETVVVFASEEMAERANRPYVSPQLQEMIDNAPAQARKPTAARSNEIIMD